MSPMRRLVLLSSIGALLLAPAWGQSRPSNPIPTTLSGYVVPVAYGPPDFRVNVTVTVNPAIPETAAVQLLAGNPTFGVDVYRTHSGWMLDSEKIWVNVKYVHIHRDDPEWLNRAVGTTTFNLNQLLNVQLGDVVVVEPHPMLLDNITVSVIDNQTNDPFGWVSGRSTIQVKRRN